MIGISAPLAELAADLDPVAVGQHQVDDRRVGRAHRGAVERLLRVLGRHRPRSRRRRSTTFSAAGSAARRRRRARGARRSRRRAPPTRSSSLPARAAARSRSVVPWPGSDSAQTCPPFASTKPRAIASPSPEPPWPSDPSRRAAVERLEDALELVWAGSRARGRRRGRPCAVCTGRARIVTGWLARMAAGVLEHVRTTHARAAPRRRGSAAVSRVDRELEAVRRRRRALEQRRGRSPRSSTSRGAARRRRPRGARARAGSRPASRAALPLDGHGVGRARAVLVVQRARRRAPRPRRRSPSAACAGRGTPSAAARS